MKVITTAIAILLSLGIVMYASAETKEVCVEFNGISFCETATVIVIGEKEIPIDDPFSILKTLGNSDVMEISLWDDYEYPAFLVELSKQLRVTPDELIDILKDEDPAWGSLHELVTNYDFLKRNLTGQGVDSSTIDKLFTVIVDSIASDIREQLSEFDGVQV